MLLDRFGARTLVVVGALIMAAGQLLLARGRRAAARDHRPGAGRAGDALTFISVLAVVVAWFPARRVPLMTQLTGLIGQLGQVLSAIPFAALLHGPGWATAFGSAGGARRGRRAGGSRGAAQPAARRARRRHPRRPRARCCTSLRHAWREPGTRLGLWTHTGTQFSGTVFALLWGVPYLVAGQGMTAAGASALLTLFVLVGIVAGPLFGEFTARHPLRRSWLVITVIVGTAAVWTAVLAPAPPAPRWLLVVLVVVLALGAPGSMIGFDYARTFNPHHRQGTAVGIVNIGGFLAVAAGVVRRGGAARAGRLHARGVPGGLVRAVRVWAFALVGVLVARRRARRKLAAEGVQVPPLREVLARRRR